VTTHKAQISSVSFIGAIAGTGLPGRRPTTHAARQPRPVPALQTQG
jgi:hypothetical protein